MSTRTWDAARTAAIAYHRRTAGELVDKILALASAANYDLHYGPTDHEFDVEGVDWAGFPAACNQLREWLGELPAIWIDEDGGIYNTDPYDDPDLWDRGDGEPTYIGPETYVSVEPEILLPNTLRAYV